MPRRSPLRQRSRTVLTGTLCLSLLLGAHSSALATDTDSAPDSATVTEITSATPEDAATVPAPAEPNDSTEEKSAVESATSEIPPIEQPVEQPAEQSASAEKPNSATPRPTHEGQPIPSGTRFLRNTAATAGELILKIDIEDDGTPGFDTEDGPGKDASAKNGIVRVNDVIKYKIEYNAATGSVDDFRAKIRFPKGVYFTQLPAVCGEGSTLTPEDPMANVTIPLTTNSRDQLEEQVLDCNLGHTETSSTQVYLTPKVSNLVHHDEVLSVKSASAYADGIDENPTTSTLPSVKASAALKWELSKNSMVDTDGYAYGAAYEKCPFGTNRDCYVVRYNITMYAPDGGKGVMPAIGDVTFTDDLSIRNLYPGLTEDQYRIMEDDLDKYGPRVTAAQGYYAIPGGKIGGRSNGVTQNTELNSVRDTGTLTMEQPNGPGTPVNMRISGADFSLRTYPKFAVNPATMAVPSGRAFAVSLPFHVYFPVEAVQEFGKPRGDGVGFNAVNTFKNLEVHGFLPTDVQYGDENVANDTLKKLLAVRYPGSLTKYFGAAVSNEPNNSNTPANEFANFNGWLGDGPPGGVVHRGGDIGVAENQEIVGVMTIPGANPLYDYVGSHIVCDAWDNTKLHLKEKHWEGARKSIRGGVPTGFGRGVPSEGKAVWMTGYSNVLLPSGRDTTDAISKDQVPELKVQYSAVKAESGADVTCGDDKGHWYDSPEAVPGNDVEKMKDGVYTAVSRVRVYFVSPRIVGKFPSVANGYFMNLAVGYQIAEGLPTGTKIPNWASMKRHIGTDFNVVSMEDMLTRENIPWTTNNYDPEIHNAAPGDRLIASQVFSRITKKVRKGTTGTFGTVPPQVTGGEKVDYELRPSLSSGSAIPGILKDVWVEDCLPSSSAYLSASKEPEVIMVGSTPDDAKRAACDPGATYIRWVYHNAEANTAIDPIIVNTEVLHTSGDATHINHVQVWAEDDASPVAKRQASVNMTSSNRVGLKLAKRPLTPLVQVNPQGAANKDDHVWRIEAKNTASSNTGSIDNPVIIDVLPKNGLNNTANHGTFTFKELKPVSADHATWTVEYTSAASDAIKPSPKDPSNQPGGATKWCETIGGSDAGCPASNAEVTGIRVTRTGVMPQNHDITFDVVMTGEGNEDGDLYFNAVAASASNLQTIIGPFYRREAVYAASISDRMFIDTNANGVYDPDADQPVKSATVRLSGTDDLGNPVSLTSTTAEDGTYVFNNLRASNSDGYTVTFEIPQELKDQKYEFTTTTTKPVAEEVDNDSDANGDGVVAGIILTAGQDRNDIDAGIVKPSITLVKETNVTTASAGDTITYTFTATNNGPVALKDLKLTEDSFVNAFDQELTLTEQPEVDMTASTGELTNLEPGQKIVWTASYTVQAGDIDLGKTIRNTASVQAKSPRDTVVTAQANATVASPDDGAYSVSKTAAPASNTAVNPGDTITYTLKVTHTGGARITHATAEDDLTNVLTDADYNNDAVAATDNGTVGTVRYDEATKKLYWYGPLAKDQVVTVTYSVTAKVGQNDRITNSVSPKGPGPNPGDPVVENSKGSCDDNVGCTTQHTFVPGTYHFHKTASIEGKTGTTVAPGDIVNYTLTVKHKSGTKVQASIADHFGDILDDAELVGKPQASAGSLVEPMEPTKLQWNGELQPGSDPVTITYKVRVKAEGNNRELVNTLDNDGNLQGSCEDRKECSTTHTLDKGTYTYTKSANTNGRPLAPATVKNGQKIDYTITVAHAGGDTVYGASIRDDLNDLLQDAKLDTDTQVTVASDSGAAGNATIDEETVTIGSGSERHMVLNWTGDLAPRQVVRISYSVIVDTKAAATLDNIVTSADQDATRHSCKTAGECATQHVTELGKYTYSKSATHNGTDPNSTAVLTGNTITYTVKIAHKSGNTVKEAVVEDDITDVLNSSSASSVAPTVTNVNANIGQPGNATFVEEGNTKKIVWTGDLMEGQEVHVTYDVPVEVNTWAANTTLTNRVSTPDNTRGECAGEPDAECATVHTVAGGTYSYAKTSDPISRPGVEKEAINGDKITYTITVKHTGGDRILDAQVTDDLTTVFKYAAPDGAVQIATNKGQSGTLSTLAPSANDPILTWTGGLEPGQVVTITIPVVIDTQSSGTLLNNVTSKDKETNRHSCEGDNAQACTTAHKVEQATYHYSKSATPDGYAQPSTVVTSGSPITYKIVVSHASGNTVEGASIIDDVTGILEHSNDRQIIDLTARNLDDAYKDAGTVATTTTTVNDKERTYITWNGNLLKGQVVEISYTVVVDAEGSVTLNNTVTSDDTTSSEGDGPRHQCDPSPGKFCSTTHRVEGGTFTLNKSSNAQGKALVKDDIITYTLTARHASGDRVKEATFKDNIAALAAQGTVVYNNDAKVTSTVNGTPVQNVRGVYEEDGYLKWAGELAIGQEVTVTYTVKVLSDTQAHVVNTVETDHLQGRCESAQNCQVTDNIVDGRFVYSKTARPARTGDAAVEVFSGDTIDYTINVRHKDGTNVVTGAEIEDDLSSIWDHIEEPQNIAITATQGTATLDVANKRLKWKGDLGIGANVEITFSVKVDAKSSNATLVNEVATPENETRGDCDTTVGCRTEHQIPDGTYTYSKTSTPLGTPDNPGVVYSGDTITYTVKINHNTGDRVFKAGIKDDLSKIWDSIEDPDQIVATASSGTVTADPTNKRLLWTGDLEKGQVVTITYTVKINAANGAKLPTKVTENDDHPNTNRYSCDHTVGCATEHVVPGGKFTYQKTATRLGTDVFSGDVVTYRVTVSHASGDRLLGASVVDDLSKIWDLIDSPERISAQASAGVVTLDPANKRLLWTGDLARGVMVEGKRAANADVTIEYTVKVNAAKGGTLTNVVATPDVERGSCVDDVSCSTTHNIPAGKYTFSKTATLENGATVTAGDTLTYTLSVKHTSGDRVSKAELTDDLSKIWDHVENPEAITVTATSGTATLDPANKRLLWTGDLERGAEAMVTYAVKISATGNQTLTNNVTSSDPETGRFTCDTEVGCTTNHRVLPWVPTPPTDPEKPQSEPAPQDPQSEAVPEKPKTSKTPPKGGKMGKLLAKTGATGVATGVAAMTLAAGMLLVVSRRRKNG